MNLNEILGVWRIMANGFPATVQLWRVGGTLMGQAKFDNQSNTETLNAISFNSDQLQFTRSGVPQPFIGRVRGDGVLGTFTHNGGSFPWVGRKVPSSLTTLLGDKPKVRAIAHRAGGPGAQRVLIVVEERVLGGLLTTLQEGVSPLARYFDDMQSEGWEVVAYSYDVRSHETGGQYHSHQPSEFLDLYRFVRRFYETAQGVLAGVVLIGDFPAAGVAMVEDRQVGTTREQHELDFNGCDAALADPNGYWEWLGLMPTVPPGSPQVVRSPFDESRHPGGMLYERNQWTAPCFVAHQNAQWQVHHSERGSQKIAADPKFWVGRITAAQTAWRTGPSGLEYSAGEELRLLTDYFHRNHQHRTVSRLRKGYIFIDAEFSGSWPSDRARMLGMGPQASVVVHSDDNALPADQRASIPNYLNSFTQEYLVGQYMMHSDPLNHLISGLPGVDTPPANYPQTFTSPGSPFSVPVPPMPGRIQTLHLFVLPNRSPHSRFYLLGGCDVGAMMQRSTWQVDGLRISPGTPLHRQYGAQCLGIAYLTHCNGLAVLAHNTTSPPADYTPVYQAWQQGRCLGDGVLQLMRNENVTGGANAYRNIVFGDPTLKLSY